MKKPNGWLIALGLLTIIVICITFDRCQERKKIVPVPVSIQAQLDSVKAHQVKLQPVVDSLKNVNGELIAKDSLNKKSVAFLQSENRRLAKLAEAHIDSLGLYEPPDSNENDYEGNVKEIIAAAAADSACNETIQTLDSIIIVGAKISVLKDSAYNMLKRDFNVSIGEQKRQNKYVLTLQKQAKKRHTVNIILGALVILGTGMVLAK